MHGKGQTDSESESCLSLCSLGKSLFVDNILQKIRTQLGDLPVVHKTIRLMESEIDFQFLLEELLSVEEFPTESHPTVFHIDVSPVVRVFVLVVERCVLKAS